MPKNPKKTDEVQEALQEIANVTGLAPETGVLEALLARQAAAGIGSGKNPAAVVLGRKGGLKGGPARMAALSKKERSELGAMAAKKRWGAKKKPNPEISREDEAVLRLVQKGKTAAEIAKKLGLSTRTVEGQRKRAMAALLQGSQIAKR